MFLAIIMDYLVAGKNEKLPRAVLRLSEHVAPGERWFWGWDCFFSLSNFFIFSPIHFNLLFLTQVQVLDIRVGLSRK